MSQNRLLEEEVVDGVTVAKILVKKILDESMCQVLGRRLHELGDDENTLRLIVDFDGVEYVCSMFLSKLITLDKKQMAKGGRLRFCTIRSDILEVFKITRLEKLFVIKENRAKALEGF